jgi:hypothetical protein
MSAGVPGSFFHGGGRSAAPDAVDPEAIGAVRGDLELQHVGRDREHVSERRAGLQSVLLEHQDARVLGADRQLVLGQDHAV